MVITPGCFGTGTSCSSTYVVEIVSPGHVTRHAEPVSTASAHSNTTPAFVGAALVGALLVGGVGYVFYSKKVVAEKKSSEVEMDAFEGSSAEMSQAAPEL